MLHVCIGSTFSIVKKNFHIRLLLGIKSVKMTLYFRCCIPYYSYIPGMIEEASHNDQHQCDHGNAQQNQRRSWKKVPWLDKEFTKHIVCALKLWRLQAPGLHIGLIETMILHVCTLQPSCAVLRTYDCFHNCMILFWSVKMKRKIKDTNGMAHARTVLVATSSATRWICSWLLAFICFFHWSSSVFWNIIPWASPLARARTSCYHVRALFVRI